MKLTNKFKIPQTFVNVLERPTYNKGKSHISATQLLNSPKIVTLTNKYNDEIEQDVSQMIWSLFGSAMHGVLEHGKDDNHIVEQRLHAELDGWKISGAVYTGRIHAADALVFWFQAGTRTDTATRLMCRIDINPMYCNFHLLIATKRF